MIRLTVTCSLARRLIRSTRLKKERDQKGVNKPKTAIQKTKGPGQPTSYKPEYCAMLIAHMATGLSYETFGAIVNVSKQTVYNWERHPEFVDAKNEAFTKCQLYWERQGQLGLWSDKEGPVLNTGVWIFNMKNRFNWTDKREVSGSTDITLHKSKEQKQFIEEFKKQLEASSNERKQS